MRKCGSMLDMKALQKLEIKRRKKEKIIFLSICSKKDSDLIQGKGELSVREFERICCVLEAMGLVSLLASFELQHLDLLNILSQEFEMELESNDPGLIERQSQQYDKWLKDFCQELPTVSMRSFFKNMLQV